MFGISDIFGISTLLKMALFVVDLPMKKYVIFQSYGYGSLPHSVWMYCMLWDIGMGHTMAYWRIAESSGHLFRMQ